MEFSELSISSARAAEVFFWWSGKEYYGNQWHACAPIAHREFSNLIIFITMMSS